MHIWIVFVKNDYGEYDLYFRSDTLPISSAIKAFLDKNGHIYNEFDIGLNPIIVNEL